MCLEAQSVPLTWSQVESMSPSHLKSYDKDNLEFVLSMESGISKKSRSWKNCFLIIDDYESVPFLRYNGPQSSLTWGQAGL
jgi:hypothetical protein